jgi:hypothetical protein
MRVIARPVAASEGYAVDALGLALQSVQQRALSKTSMRLFLEWVKPYAFPIPFATDCDF